MKGKREQGALTATLLPLFVVMAAAAPSFQQGKREAYGELVVRGRVVCLSASARGCSSRVDCGGDVMRFGLAGAEGNCFTFLYTDPATAMFTDARVRSVELQITAQLHPENELEIIRIQVLKEGKLYDVHYFCDVCNITAYAPGPCPCCYRELELVERLADNP
jgi:hypothetical protein